MTRQVEPNLKDLRSCPCGCGAFGALVKRTGHARDCRADCTRCARRSSKPAASRRVPPVVRRQVATRAAGRCEAAIGGCTGAGEHAHHVRRRSQGGRDVVSNLRWVCNRCHTWIHANPAEATRLGLLERTSTDGD